MEIRLDLGSPDTPPHVAAGRLDVGNAAASQQISALPGAAGTGWACGRSGTQVAVAAGRSAVDPVRHRTADGGHVVVGRPVVGRPAPADVLGEQRREDSL